MALVKTPHRFAKSSADEKADRIRVEPECEVCEESAWNLLMRSCGNACGKYCCHETQQSPQELRTENRLSCIKMHVISSGKEGGGAYPATSPPVMSGIWR